MSPPALDNPPSWRVCVDGHDLVTLYRAAKAWLSGEDLPEGLEPRRVGDALTRAHERLERSLLRREDPR